VGPRTNTSNSLPCRSQGRLFLLQRAYSSRVLRVENRIAHPFKPGQGAAPERSSGSTIAATNMKATSGRLTLVACAIEISIGSDNQSAVRLRAIGTLARLCAEGVSGRENATWRDFECGAPGVPNWVVP
jgi:hypothetical protein